MAAEYGHTEIVEALLEKGADVNSVETTVSIHEDTYNICND